MPIHRLSPVHLLLLLLSFYSVNVLANEKVATVVITKNQVDALRVCHTVELARKNPVFENDVVRTSQQARTQLRFNDGTLLTLGADTEMAVLDFKFGNGQTPSAKFELLTGVFRMVTDQITKVKSPSLEIATPLGSIGIRGTDFWGGFLEKDKIDIILLEGEHEIVVENQFGRVEISEPGTGVTIESGKAPSSPYPWSVEKLARAVESVAITP